MILDDIVIGPIAIDEKIPKHDNDDRDRQGEILGEKIWGQY